MELNKQFGLDENKLDHLDTESDNAEQKEKPQPKEYDDGEQSISYGGLDVHFTCTTPERTCELFMWLLQQLTKPIKNNGGSSYLG